MRHLLAFSLLLIIFLAGVWDIVAVARSQPSDTVSTILQQWSILFPVLPLMTGILLGHIFWPTGMPVKKD